MADDRPDGYIPLSSYEHAKDEIAHLRAKVTQLTREREAVVKDARELSHDRDALRGVVTQLVGALRKAEAAIALRVEDVYDPAVDFDLTLRAIRAALAAAKKLTQA